MSISQVWPLPWGVSSPVATLAMVVGAVLCLVSLVRRRPTRPSSPVSSPPSNGAARYGSGTKSFAKSTEIEALADFDWRTEEPLQLRPFKPKYNMTMALQKSTMSELIVMDKNYLDRITLRKQIMRDHPDVTVAAHAAAEPAVREFYRWLMATYLPTRFPTMFVIRNGPPRLRNLVDGAEYPLTPPASPLEALRALGAVVDDDLNFLLPPAAADDDDDKGYVLRAFVGCFPSGFDMRTKLNTSMRRIHQPVPRYREKMETSMDRFFARVEVGTFVKRANWTVSDKPLFAISGSHYYDGEVNPADTFRLEKAHVRCERQVLHRLPQTGALLLSTKTYMYPLAEVKQEGSGPALTEAIDGLFRGNVPEMAFYKRAVKWGEPVKAYLGA